MRHFRTMIAFVFGLLAMMSASTSVAQTTVRADSIEQTYVITRGTTLWKLAQASLGNGDRWHELFELNYRAGLLDSSRIKPSGGRIPVVNLTIGDRLLLSPSAALDSSSMVEPVTTSPSSLIRQDTVIVSKLVPVKEGVSDGVFWTSIGLLAAAAIALLAFVIARHRKERSGMSRALETAAAARSEAEAANRTISLQLIARDAQLEETRGELGAALEHTRHLVDEANRPPAERFERYEIRAMALFPVMLTDEESDGPDFIPGGIQSDEDLALAFQRSAQIAAARRHPDITPPHHSHYRFRQGVRGRVIEGRYRSLFANGTARERVILRDDPDTYRIVWRAEQVEEDGTTHYTYVEEICANGMGLPTEADEGIVWVPMAESDPAFSDRNFLQLPESVLHQEPVVEEVIEATAAAPVTIETFGFQTPSGEIVYVPVGSTFLGPINSAARLLPERTGE